MVRPIYAETQRYKGGYSKPGEYVYDHPFQWGSRRIGPDLFREGGLRAENWHYRHFLDPPAMTPGSIMPPYRWLLDGDADFLSLPSRMKAMQALGVPYTDEQVAGGEQASRNQARDLADRLDQQEGGSITGVEKKQVIALIAYLQRLGTDLNAKTNDPTTTQPVTSLHPGDAANLAEGGAP
jgi:cytochrome c oxidase cbb3-type subunit I/II